MRLRVFLGALGLGIVSIAASADEARACGGCFHGPTQNGDVITDHRMIFRVSPQQTTLYDEIEYQGNPASFAWVLPIKGQVTVGLSADVVFSVLDNLTQTTIDAPPLPQCPSCSCANFGGGGSSGSSGGPSAGADAGAVNIIAQQVVGPYDSVQLSSTDPNALTAWLTANGYSIPTDIQPIIAAYVNEGFDFLALKLQPGQGVQAMRPVRVTAPGAGLSLPLRMVSAGTGATVGIALWVLADGRYEAQNFTNFVIQPSELVWDWSTNTSNFATLRQQKEAAANFAAWQTESSLDMSPYQIEDGINAGIASDDYLAIPASDAGGDGGAGETADQVRLDDLNTLFPGSNQSTVRVTRMRADLAHAALANDLVLQASADQSTISNNYAVTQSVNAPTCPPVPNPCPPCGGSSGASSSGIGSSSSGAGSSSGAVGSLGGGATTKGAAPGQESFGCSAAPTEGGGPWVDLALAGLLGFSFLRSRAKRRR
jgi:hypothetical protein